MYETPHNDDFLICEICPHKCRLSRNEIGKCLVRQNTGDHIELSYYGKCALIALEPIEKRPLFHFYPGSKHLSVGLLGCQLRCKFCQNYKISQNNTANSKYYSPEDLVSLAHDKNASGISFTFNEPLVHYEYIRDVCVSNKLYSDPLHIAVKTNGFISNWVLEDLCSYVSAFNVDIKGDTESYADVCDGKLSSVLESIETIIKHKVHLEISYLVMPQMLHNKVFHKKIRNWLFSMDSSIPVHILYFYPFYRMTQEGYNQFELTSISDLFKEKMDYVYISNIFEREYSLRNTLCPCCSSVMISRNKSNTNICKLICCNKSLKGMFAETPYNLI